MTMLYKKNSLIVQTLWKIILFV